MSSISFNSPSGEVRVSGRERAMMGSVCASFRKMQMGDWTFDELEWVEHVTLPGHYLHNDAVRLRSLSGDAMYEMRRRLRQTLDTYFSVGDDGAIILDGKPVDLFCLTLNSALAWGNRAVQLAAKLHGQCEIHAYCEGEDRVWLAELVEEAVEVNVFRPEPWGYDGWHKVAEFLRASDNEPVVTSYSVTDSFPNPSFLPDDVEVNPDDQWEAWSQFDSAQQWEWSMEKLRGEGGLRISPDRLDAPFGDGMTGSEFMQRARSTASNQRHPEVAAPSQSS